MKINSVKKTDANKSRKNVEKLEKLFQISEEHAK
jgi:hypothetical protein